MYFKKVQSISYYVKNNDIAAIIFLGGGGARSVGYGSG